MTLLIRIAEPVAIAAIGSMGGWAVAQAAGFTPGDWQQMTAVTTLGATLAGLLLWIVPKLSRDLIKAAMDRQAAVDAMNKDREREWLKALLSQADDHRKEREGWYETMIVERKAERDLRHETNNKIQSILKPEAA